MLTHGSHGTVFGKMLQFFTDPDENCMLGYGALGSLPIPLWTANFNFLGCQTFNAMVHLVLS